MAAISINNLSQAIYESSKTLEGRELDQFLEKTVHYLRDRHLLSKAPQILSALQKIIDTEEKVVRAKVSSKDKLSKKSQADIEDILKKRYRSEEVVLEHKEDPYLVGGIKIEVGDEVIDGTIRNKLGKLQTYLMAN